MTRTEIFLPLSGWAIHCGRPGRARATATSAGVTGFSIGAAAKRERT
jgi:hypothetical protein